MKKDNQSRRINELINMRARLQSSVKSRRIGIITDQMKANEGVFVNRLIYPVHFNDYLMKKPFNL